MTSSARPFLTHVLIGMLLIGHAPAWLHVAGVLHPHHIAPIGKVVGSEHEHGCSCKHHNHGPVAAPSDTSGKQPADSGCPDHGPCALCQSLAGTVGVLTAQVGCELIVPMIDAAPVLATRSVAENWLATPQPRGPPGILA